MKPGRYATDDGSFARSAGGAGARGLALLAVALLIGIVLLNATDADPPGATLSAQGDSDTAEGDGAESDAAGEGEAEPDGGADAGTAATVAPTTTPPARAPKDVKVVVANASDVNGAAGNAKKALDPVGFNVLAPTNAAKVAESAVFFTAGFQADAIAVANALGLPTTTVKAIPAPPPFDTKGANVAVVIGADHGAKFAAAPATAGATGSTTTTAAVSATTTTKKP